MTDKQIIDLTEIDKKYKDKCSLIKAGKCKNVNIFIEQSRKLKAKEQECERLKKSIEHWKMEHKEAKAKAAWTYDLVKKRLGEQLDKLKAENEKLKKDLHQKLH